MLGRSAVRVGVCGTARRSTGPLHVSGTELALAGGTAELVFPPQAGRDHGAQRSGPRPGNEVFALLGRTGTGQTVRSLSPTPRSPQTVSLASPGPPAAQPPSWSLPVLALPVWSSPRSLRLPPPSPSASDQSAADGPGPPKHLGLPRGDRRYRGNARSLRSCSPTTRSHLGPDLGPPSSPDAITS